MATITHKTGDTFEITCSVPIAFGSTLTGVRSQARSGKNLIQEFTYTLLPATSTEFKYRLSATKEQTRSWPTRQLLCDIEYISGDKVASTENFIIDVLQDQTI